MMANLFQNRNVIQTLRQNRVIRQFFRCSSFFILATLVSAPDGFFGPHRGRRQYLFVPSNPEFDNLPTVHMRIAGISQIEINAVTGNKGVDLLRSRYSVVHDFIDLHELRRSGQIVWDMGAGLGVVTNEINLAGGRAVGVELVAREIIEARLHRTPHLYPADYSVIGDLRRVARWTRTRPNKILYSFSAGFYQEPEIAWVLEAASNIAAPRAQILFVPIGEAQPDAERKGWFDAMMTFSSFDELGLRVVRASHELPDPHLWLEKRPEVINEVVPKPLRELRSLAIARRMKTYGQMRSGIWLGKH